MENSRLKKSLTQLKQSYLDGNDITEVKFANENFPSFGAWLKFAERNINIVSMWRKELELKLKQEAYSAVFDVMRNNTRDRLQAAKFLLSKGVLSRDGTPEVTEEEVVERVKNQEDRKADNDYLRLVKA